MGTSVKIKDISGDRVYEIQSGTEKCPNSVFLTGPGGFCAEFNRDDVVMMLKLAYGLYDSVDLSLQMLLAEQQHGFDEVAPDLDDISA